MNPFVKRREQLLAMRALRERQSQSPTSAGSPLVCPQCERDIAPTEYALLCCPHCGHHAPMGCYQRLRSVLDGGSYRPLEWKESGSDPLNFPQYREKLAKLQQKTGLSEAVVCGTGTIGGNAAVLAVMDSRFMMGSMGTVVGERITRTIEYAAAHKIPLIIFAASGGARMQEGILSLMQMAKTSGALAKLAQKKVPYFSVLTHPTTGGVTASFASLGDIILAEPNALIGFAGPRVIRETIGEELPQGFQRSEYLLEHGFVDAIVTRDEMKENTNDGGYIRHWDVCGICLGREGEYLKISQRNKFLKGDVADVLETGKKPFKLKLDEIYDQYMNEIDSAPHATMTVYVKTDTEVKAGAYIRIAKDNI